MRLPLEEGFEFRRKGIVIVQQYMWRTSFLLVAEYCEWLF